MNYPLVYHPEYSIPWPAVHRFPMSKFQALREYLLREGLAAEAQFVAPTPASPAMLGLVHEQAFIDAFLNGTLDAKALRRIGLGWRPELVRRTRAEVGGTLLAAQLALQHGFAANTAGGTHHAFPDYGSGFCVLNDVAVACRDLLDRRLASRILVFDLDVHQGDGTAFIFRDEPRVFTCSFHCQKNFPFRKQQSDLDVAFEPGSGDAAYLARLDEVLPAILTAFRPDLVIYNAGVDVHEGDRLGHLQLTYGGMQARDLSVLRVCHGLDTPLACVIGGGYAANIDELVYRHSLLFRAAAQVFGSS